MKLHYYKNDILQVCDKKHLTVEQIFVKLAKKYPEIGKSSVYRNVEEMVESWELRKIVWIWKKAYFERNCWNKHIHLIDEQTWAIFDIDNNIELSNLPKNFQVSNVDIKVFGTFN